MAEVFKKTCTRCNENYPATSEYFAKYKRVCLFCVDLAAAEFPETAKQYCPNGHLYDAYSIKILPSENCPNGERRCQECNRQTSRKCQRNKPRIFTQEEREQQREYRQAHKGQAKQYMISYTETNKPALSIKNAANYQQNRAERLSKTKQRGSEAKERVFAHYGNRCACCGVADSSFLTLDHKNNDGAQHRKDTGILGGVNMCMWIIRNGFPDMFQLLCWNCNCSKQYSETKMCSHEIVRQRLAYWMNLDKQELEQAA